MRRLKSLTKSALCAAYLYSGAARVQEWMAQRAGRRFMAILLFHRVTDAIPEDGLTVGTARFRAICGMLRRHFRVVPLAEVFDTLRSGRDMPPRTVAITFDDCYRDNLFAARVLAEHGLPAAFFVPTAYVGTDRSFPWDCHLPPMPNLGWDDVREMVRLGHEIGSHTVNHPNLGTAPCEEARKNCSTPRRCWKTGWAGVSAGSPIPSAGGRTFGPRRPPLPRRPATTAACPDTAASSGPAATPACCRATPPLATKA